MKYLDQAKIKLSLHSYTQTWSLKLISSESETRIVFLSRSMVKTDLVE
jgi:hypothetical protein